MDEPEPRPEQNEALLGAAESGAEGRSGSEGDSSGGLVSQLASVAEPVASVMEPIVDAIVTPVAEYIVAPVAEYIVAPVAEHIVTPVAGAIGSVLEAAVSALAVRDVIAERRLGRAVREPLANLYELYPEAREAAPRELGMRFVPVEDIRGTAVAGIAQRGGDFLPLRPFRGHNWEARWDRIRAANARLQPLPPIDVVKFNGEYWVVDGHNRVAAALYGGQVGLDAVVVELVPLDGQASERPSHMLSLFAESGELRAAAQGRRPAVGMRRAEMNAGLPEDLEDLETPTDLETTGSSAEPAAAGEGAVAETAQPAARGSVGPVPPARSIGGERDLE